MEPALAERGSDLRTRSSRFRLPESTVGTRRHLARFDPFPAPSEWFRLDATLTRTLRWVCSSSRPHTPWCAPDGGGPSGWRFSSVTFGQSPSGTVPIVPGSHLRASGRPAEAPKDPDLILPCRLTCTHSEEPDPSFRACALPAVSASRSGCSCVDRRHPATSRSDVKGNPRYPQDSGRNPPAIPR
jgi:hypothetical protein